MPDDADLLLEAVAALRGNGVEAELRGDEFERWRIGDFVLDDATLLRLVTWIGLVEDGEAR